MAAKCGDGMNGGLRVALYCPGVTMVAGGSDIPAAV